MARGGTDDEAQRMELNPAKIARQTFPMVSHGFDPQAVGPFLESVAARIHVLESELEQANSLIGRLRAEVAEATRKEEALTLTMQTAAEERADILSAARREAGQMLRAAKAEADRIESVTAGILARAESEAAETREAAADEARAVVQEARREAVRVSEESRVASTEARQASQREEAAIRERIDALRSRLDAAAAPLQELAAASRLVETVRDGLPREEARPQISARPARVQAPGLAADFDVVAHPRDVVAISVGATTLTVAQLDSLEDAVTKLVGEESVPAVVEEVQRAILGVSSKVASSDDRRRYLDALRQIN